MDLVAKYMIGDGTAEYEIVNWSDSNFSAFKLRDANNCTTIASAKDLVPVDPSAPNEARVLHEAAECLFRERSRVFPKATKSFESLLDELTGAIHKSDGRFAAAKNAFGPMRDLARGVKSLDELDAQQRSMRACQIACQVDPMAFKHVPERFRTDVAETAFLEARKRLRKEAEAKAQAEAQEEAKRAKRRAQAAARKAKKKAMDEEKGERGSGSGREGVDV